MPDFIDMFSSRTRSVFSFENLQKVAAQTGFYKRKSGFTPELFFDLLLYCSASSNSISLEHNVAMLSDLYGINISKQSLDERFSESAVNFIKEILKQAMEVELGYFCNPSLFPHFNYVRIKDSTRFNVDNRLVKHFKGSGGNGTRKSCVCIQYEYDIKSGKILDMTITSGTVNDATNTKETQCCINTGDLVIRDLGYYNLDVLSSFDRKGAYFISRLNMTTSIYYIMDETLISFEKLYDEMVQKQVVSMEMDVLVSKGQKKRLRLILTIMPDEEYEKRLRKVNKHNKENGYSTSDDYKARARFNIFITNITGDVMSKEEIMLLYRLRWQIELTFKTWKSVCAIDKLQPMKYERFICILMSKLILIVLKLKMFWNMSNYHFRNERKLLSMYKCFKTFQETYQMLRAILKSDKKKSQENVLKYIIMFSKNHWKEKRKNRKNYEEIVDLFICNSDNYEYIQQEKERAA